jgi:hypothetical protein
VVIHDEVCTDGGHTVFGTAGSPSRTLESTTAREITGSSEVNAVPVRDVTSTPRSREPAMSAVVWLKGRSR